MCGTRTANFKNDGDVMRSHGELCGTTAKCVLRDGVRSHSIAP
jgi:hypothetical protein